MTASIACTGFVTGYKRAWVQVYDELILKKPGVMIRTNMQATLQVRKQLLQNKASALY